MNLAPVEERQQRIRSVLDRLAQAQPPRIGVRLFTSAGAVRGLLNPAPGARRQDPPAARSLRVGEELHVVVDAPQGGCLHVFNLGTSGEAKKLVPEAGLTISVEAGRAYRASPDGQPWVEHGPANGFPERVLAIVTEEDRPLFASNLHPAWGDAAYVRSVVPSGFGSPSVESILSAWPLKTWTWGLCEISVTGWSALSPTR